MSVWILIMYLSGGKNGGPLKIELPTKEECVRVDAVIRKQMHLYVDQSVCVEVKK